MPSFVPGGYMDTENLVKKVSESIHMTDIDAAQYSPLTLAYVGDAVYELVVRTMLAGGANTSVNRLNKKSSSLVSAGAQSSIVKSLLDRLSDEEMAVFKRGRNAKSNTKAKNATFADYRTATGFETLIGYLYMSGQSDRMLELITAGLELYQ